jgi:hypothetical protein
VNVGTYLLLTVPLVGGSLYVYDGMRSDPAPVVLDTAPHAAPAGRSASAEPTGPLLQADSSAQVERLVRETVERMRKEQQASGGTTGVLPSAGSDGGLPGASAPALALGSDPEAVEGPAASFDERTMRVFRAYLEEAQRLRQEEERTKRVLTTLDTLGVSLTDGQRKSVAATTLKFHAQARELVQKLPGGENLEARKKAGQELRDAYSKSIYDIAPSAEAEKIVAELGTFRGWMDGVAGGQGGLPGRGGGNGRNRTGGQAGDGK